MKFNTLQLSVIVVLALSFTASISFGQANGNFSISGTVLTPLTVNGINMAFGDIIPGHSKSVVRTSVANAGSFAITGDASREISATFTLPSNMTKGADNLPISFSATDGGFNTANTQASAVAFDPSAVQTWSFVETGVAYVWLGGTVTPSLSQAGGAYSGSVTLTVDYTGN